MRSCFFSRRKVARSYSVNTTATNTKVSPQATMTIPSSFVRMDRSSDQRIKLPPRAAGLCSPIVPPRVGGFAIVLIGYDRETDCRNPAASTRPIPEIRLLHFIDSDFGYLLPVSGGSHIIAFKLRHQDRRFCPIAGRNPGQLLVM